MNQLLGGIALLLLSPLLFIECLSDDSYLQQNALAGKLYNALSEDENANIFFSPFSISFALSALALGTGGKTFKELQSVLSLPNDEADILKTISRRFTEVISGDENLTIANGFFVDNNFKVKDNFLLHLKNEFHADFQDMDFRGNPEKSMIVINKWVENKTKSIIKDLLSKDAIDTDTLAVFVNAVYFKSEWIHPFNVQETKLRPFYALDEEYEVEMMLIRRKFNYKFLDNLHSHLILLPYVGNYRMLMVVPEAKDGIIQLDAKLKKLVTNETFFLDSLVSDVEKTSIKLFVPKCSLEVETNLKDILQKIGVKSLFDVGSDLKKISDNPNLVVSDAVHKANIKIDEISTEAAAASGFTITNRMMIIKQKPITIKADHPFVFAILHKVTKTIIFLGRVSHF